MYCIYMGNAIYSCINRCYDCGAIVSNLFTSPIYHAHAALLLTCMNIYASAPWLYLCRCPQVDDGYQTAWGDWSSLKPSFDPQQSIFATLAQAGGQLLPTGGGVTAALNLLSSHGKQQEEDRQGGVRGAEGQGGNGKGFRDMRSLAADIQKAGKS